MNIREALRLGSRPQIAISGAGGKTTAAFQIARAYDSPVVVTTTTHLGEWQAQLADHHLFASRPEDIEGAAGQIEGVTLVTGNADIDHRLRGLDSATLDALHSLAIRLGFPLLIEADGARQLPLKAPADHEPVIPAWVDTVVVLAGLSAVGKPLTSEFVHRHELYSMLSGQSIGADISIDTVIKVLNSSQGGRKGIPQGARSVALLNQMETVSDSAFITQTASGLLPAYDAVLLASTAESHIFRVIEPVGAVILAAGGSERFGQPKVLLPWQGKPLVRLAVEAALQGGIEHIIVVTGAVEGPVRAALEGLPVQYAHNPSWQAGQSTSLRAGLALMPAQAGAALFLLADQPFINSDVIRALVDQHQQSLSAVIAPRVGEQRANPVLFDRVTFGELMKLSGDTGGRAIFGHFPPAYLPWEDSRLLVDIDTPEDFSHLMEQG